jgi:membrane-bound inhibitor of C-type lysozyme
MKKLMPYALCLMPWILAACSVEKPIATDNIRCGDYNIEIKVYQDKIIADINGERTALPQTISASGVRYAGRIAGRDGGLWNKGADWTMFPGEDVWIECE